MREDIVRGLKNAIERGEPLEKAVQSFINAGYNPVEVKQAAQGMIWGATAVTNPYAEQLGMENLPQMPMKRAKPEQISLSEQTSIPWEAQMQARQQPVLGGQMSVQQSIQTGAAPAYRKLSEVQPMRMQQTMPYKRRNAGLIITLIIILLLLIGGLIYMILYGQAFLNSLLGG